MKWRSIFMAFFIVLVFVFLLINLFDLQIVNGEENLIKAKNISQSVEIVRASRGIIYDANKNILAKNIPTYTVYIKPEEFDTSGWEVSLSKLSKILGVDTMELEKTYRSKLEEGEYEGGKITISNDITDAQYLDILVNQEMLQGVYAQVDTRRSYPYTENFAHILGYVSDINEAEVNETGLDPNANIGKEGLEKIYDTQLRGRDGHKLQTLNILKREKEEYLSETPVKGNNLVLTLDVDWQMKLHALLKARTEEAEAFGGAAIIMESDTGSIKAMVSYPSYDNNLFAKGISSTDFSKLNTDLSTPLVNRAIALQLPTGSTFKPMVAAAALQEAVITSNTVFDSGCVELPLYKLCEADNRYLGKMTVIEGIGKSSNVFFCRTGLAMTEKAEGIRTLKKYTDQFGIGFKTGVDLPGEQAGTMASPELKQSRLGEPWYLADICNTVIGQGLVTSTPIQMVTVASAISNNGKIYQPALVDRVENQSGEVVEKIQRKVVRNVEVDPSHFATIREGMKYAVNGEMGSAWLLKGMSGNPIAKTGSADAIEYRDGKKVEGAHSWAIGGFEYQGVNYSFVVHLQEGGRGYQSIPIIHDFLSWLY